jgi:hypothetical protein
MARDVSRRDHSVRGGSGKATQRVERVEPSDDMTAPRTAARVRMLLALVAWIVVAAISIGSLLYTTLGR